MGATCGPIYISKPLSQTRAGLFRVWGKGETKMMVATSLAATDQEIRNGSLKDILIGEHWAMVGEDPSLDALIEGIQQGVSLAKLSRLYAAHMVKRFKGKKAHAALALGIDRRTIQRWEKKGYAFP